MALCDHNGQLVESNNAFYTILADDYLKGKIGENLFEVIELPQETKESLIKGEKTCYKTEYSFEGEKKKELEIRINGITGENGENLFLISFKDITKEKSNESEINNYKAFIKNTAVNSPDGYFIGINRELCITTIYGQKITDGSIISKYSIGKSLEEILSTAEFNQIENCLKQVFNGEIVHCEVLFRNNNNYRVTFIPFKLENGVVEDISVIAINITEHENVKQVFLINQELYHRIFENAPVGIFHTTLEGHIIDANPMLAKIFGYDSVAEFVETVNKSNLVDVLFLDKAQRGMILNPLLSSDKWENVEYCFLRKDGQVITTNLILRSIKLPGNENIFIEGFVEDITERKNAEQDRIRLESQIQRSQKLNSLGILAGGIAHDFNNLLSCIFGFIDLANKSESLFKIKGFLGQAMEAFNRARGLTMQLLTFAKGGAPVCKIGNIAETLKNGVEFALSGSNVAVRFEIDDNALYCDFDENQIGQVIDNIVINAKQAMPSGGELAVSAQKIYVNEGSYAGLKEGDYIKISFSDNGPGISEDVLPHIFDPFFTTKEKGEGLGLSMVYSIIQRHKGFIDVISNPGKGATFFILLPVSTEPETLSVINHEREHNGKGLILVMDDEILLTTVLSELIQSMGYETILAKDGKEALELFSLLHKSGKSPFKAAILDLTIRGGMGGKEVIQEIRKNDQRLKVFASSGYSDDPVMSEPSRYLFTDSIMKPFTRDDISIVFEKHRVGN